MVQFIHLYNSVAMEELRSLVNVTKKHKIKNIQVVSRPAGSKTSKLFQLFEGIAEEQFKNDDEAMMGLYQSNKEENIRAAYKKLKRRLEKRLHNTVFFIDSHEARFKSKQKAYYYCFKQLATVKILIGRGARPAAIPLAEKTLRKAIEFEITPVVIELATDLRNHYAVHGGTSAQCRKLDDMVEQYSCLRRAEQMAEQYYSSLMLKAAKKRSTDPALEKDACRYLLSLELELKQLKQRKLSSYRFYQLYFLIKIIKNEICGNKQLAVETCQEAIHHFQNSRKDDQETFLFSFFFKLLQTQMQAGQLDKARQTANRCEDLLYARKQSTDWIQVKYCRALLSFQTRHYQEAYSIYQNAATHKLFKNQSPQSAERWKIINAYLHYLIEIGKVSQEAAGQTGRFRLGRFLNDFFIVSKDKLGYNIDLIALQVLFHLHWKQFDKIIDQAEPWTSYADRLRRKRVGSRAHYFLRLLLCLEKHNFHPLAVRRHAVDWLKKLQQTEVDTQLEIIPYEHIWELILSSLDRTS